MTCDEAIQLLPWLLNGTLEEGERRELRRHLETCEGCREALGETREAWRLFDQHLPAETLVALSYGEVPSGIDPALAERHLASCPECAAELELARTSRRLEEDDKIALFPGRPARKDRGESRSWKTAALAASLVGAVAASGWIHSARELRSVSEEAAQRPPAPVAEPAPPAASGGEATGQQVAAMAAQVQELERRLGETARQLEELESQPRGTAEPQVNLSFLPLAAGIERGEGGENFVVAANGYTIVTLDPSGPKTRRRAEIRGSAGKVYETAELLPSEDEFGQYSILLKPGFLKPGRYTIQLFEDGKPAPTETYTIRVR